MGIFRVIIIGVVIWGIWILYRRFIQGRNASSQEKLKPKDKFTQVHQCALCGVHVPDAEAIKKNNHYYCSQAHCDQHNAQ